MKKLKLLSLFSGLGAFEKALERLGIDFEVVNYCEWDEPIAKCYSVLHNVPIQLNLGDISKVDPKTLAYFDLMTYGFPCTDLSVAKTDGEGLKGKQSGLLYEALRIAEHCQPKYLIAENVRDLVTRHGEGFADMLKRLEAMGYNNYWKILDAKDFGVPQERYRVFVISIRKDVDDGTFTFPTGRPLTPETSQWWEFIDTENTRDLTNRQKRMVDAAKGINTDDSIKFEGEVQFERAIISLRQSGLRFQANPYFPTVVRHYGTGGGNFPMIAYNGVVGGVTPRHCFQLMGFDVADHDKLANAGIARSLLYIMSGNSIVVNVLEDIFENLFKGEYAHVS